MRKVFLFAMLAALLSMVALPLTAGAWGVDPYAQYDSDPYHSTSWFRAEAQRVVNTATAEVDAVVAPCDASWGVTGVDAKLVHYGWYPGTLVYYSNNASAAVYDWIIAALDC